MKGNGPQILNKDIELTTGDNIRWGSGIVLGPSCRRVSIGYGCFIGNDVYIDVENLTIGDYVTIHHGSTLHGIKCTIGHNNWIGQYTILDSLGGLLTLGNNVGVGAHSQLWSHMKFGDLLEGCRWFRNGSLEVGDDAWFVGHCIVAPIKVEDRAMLLVGGLATRDMKYNHTYAGSPAVDVTDKIGPQFGKPLSCEEKEKRFEQYINDYKKTGENVGFIRYCCEFSKKSDDRYSWFNLASREYIPTHSPEEFRFMKFLLYEKAKFIPVTGPEPGGPVDTA